MLLISFLLFFFFSSVGLFLSSSSFWGSRQRCRRARIPRKGGDGGGERGRSRQTSSPTKYSCHHRLCLRRSQVTGYGAEFPSVSSSLHPARLLSLPFTTPNSCLLSPSFLFFSTSTSSFLGSPFYGLQQRRTWMKKWGRRRK